MKNKEYTLPLLLGAVLTLAVSAVMLLLHPLCAGLCMLLGVLLLLLFALYTRKRYEKLRELNNYLSLICSGNYDLDIADNAEGELSILKNQLYKVILTLKTQKEVIEKDKLYLADSLADISHQLKTPLTSMMVITDLMKKEKNEAKRTEFVEVIDTQLEKMRWLILTLLKLSRLDADTAEFHFSPQSAASILDESLKPFLVTLDLKNIAVEKSITDFTFSGDRNWSVEAVQNILKNCVEHTAPNGTIRIATASTPLYDEITIADNGAGFDEEDLPHLFERFYHGKNAAPDSIGIGLALSKTILNKQHAAVEAENDGGAKFTIRFYKAIV